MAKCAPAPEDLAARSHCAGRAPAPPPMLAWHGCAWWPLALQLKGAAARESQHSAAADRLGRPRARATCRQPRRERVWHRRGRWPRSLRLQIRRDD